LPLVTDVSDAAAVRDMVAAVDAQYQIDRCVAGGDDTYCAGILRNKQGTIFSFSNALQNIGGINSRGFDFTATYRSPRTPYGKFRATSTSSFLLAYEEIVPAGTGFVTDNLTGLVSGSPERAFPRLKSNLGLTWLFKQIELTLTTRYISSLTEQCRGFTGIPNTCSNPNPGKFPSVAPRADATRRRRERDESPGQIVTASIRQDEAGDGA